MYSRHKFCRKKLHEMTGSNVIAETYRANGKTYVVRRCRQCRHAFTNRYWVAIEKQRRAERKQEREKS